MRMVDTHGHYVFDVDDGASTLEMSVSMIREAHDQGVRDIICTSHSWGDCEAYAKRLPEIRERLGAERIPVRLYRGTEIACSEWKLPAIVDQLAAGNLYPLGNSNYILLEFDPGVRESELLRCIERLKENATLGRNTYRPVVAHVERYHCFRHNPAGIDALRKLEVPLQINAFSLVEEKNEATRALARGLLADRLVTFLGSDAHRLTHRPPKVRSGLEYIYATCDREYADGVCFRNAEQLLLDEEPMALKNSRTS